MLFIHRMPCPFADATSVERSAFDDSARNLHPACVILILYSGPKEYGHRRQKLFMDFRVWPETAIRLSLHRNPSPVIWKPRWLLWLEDTSTDASRRAAAALRY